MHNMTNGINTIVTSIYELKYDKRNEVYKNNQLLTETLDHQIFDEFNYIVYTDNYTANKYDLVKKYSSKNIQVKFFELNSKFYTDILNPLRKNILNTTETYDRIYTVNNYIEVINNKLLFLLNEAINSGENSNLIWLDSGLLGTSCHDLWRDYIKQKIYDNPIFLRKLFDKINQHGSLFLKGNKIIINYEIRDRLKSDYNIIDGLIPGAFFGGKSKVLIELLQNQNVLETYVNKYNALISEQEVLTALCSSKENIKFYEFDDWGDLQKVLLKITDCFDPIKYELLNPTYYKKNI